MQSFHKECFKCGTCNKGLDSISCCEGPDRDIYCKGVIFFFLPKQKINFKSLKFAFKRNNKTIKKALLNIRN